MSNFKISTNGRKFIELWEGLRLHAYRDSGGVWTIGYGHTSAAGLPYVRAGMLITPEEADAILTSDLAAIEADVNHHVAASINQNQFDALGAFDFNTGALDRSSLLRAINLGHLESVRADFLAWDHVHGHVVAGLEHRRLAEYLLFTTGEVKGP